MNIFIISLSIYILFVILKTSNSLHMLQQNRYNRGNKYLKWIKENFVKNYMSLEVMLLLFPILDFFNKKGLAYFFGILYLGLIIIFLSKKSYEKTKLPLKYTGRIIRLYVTTMLLYGIIIFLVLKGYDNDDIGFYTIFLAIASYFNNLMVVVANIINMPIEKMISIYFKNKATKKLQSFPNMKVVGITGSYGKTSSKNIVNDVLNIKFNATPSPKNYNTPFGLMITINDYLDKYNDFFIAEMGACKCKEIKELCDLVHPTYGILTKIGVSHLETFGSVENIRKTKFELIESLPLEGIGILNADDELQVTYPLKNKCKIIWVGIENTKKCDVYAKNIKLSAKGTTFDCYFKDKKETITLTTSLLGKANIYNVLAAVALGDALGLTKEQLILGVKKVQPVEHRLELKSLYGMTLIDDAYNANPEGAKMALEVLDMMKGDKIVVTSGIIELGEKSEQLNKELGHFMAGVADTVLLIGEKQTKAIKEGLKEKKFKDSNMHTFHDIMEAFEFLKKNSKKNTYILLQSDLPDIFNER